MGPRNTGVCGGITVPISVPLPAVSVSVRGKSISGPVSAPGAGVTFGVVMSIESRSCVGTGLSVFVSGCGLGGSIGGGSCGKGMASPIKIVVMCRPILGVASVRPNPMTPHMASDSVTPVGSSPRRLEYRSAYIVHLHLCRPIVRRARSGCYIIPLLAQETKYHDLASGVRSRYSTRSFRAQSRNPSHPLLRVSRLRST